MPLPLIPLLAAGGAGAAGAGAGVGGGLGLGALIAGLVGGGGLLTAGGGGGVLNALPGQGNKQGQQGAQEEQILTAIMQGLLSGKKEEEPPLRPPNALLPRGGAQPNPELLNQVLQLLQGGGAPQIPSLGQLIGGPVGRR